MQCCNNNHKKAIILVRGNDTNFNNASFLTIRFITEILDLSTFKAVFKLGNITKTFNDISSGEIVINFTAAETARLLTECYGTLNLIDTSNRIATIENRIPFEVISVVDGNAIATEPYTLNFDVKQGGETILNISVESAVTVEVGTTTTLPAGSSATVTNSGTGNHLILNFGIPRGQDGLTPEWGNISGTLSNQTDLQAALDLKADKTELDSVTGALADSITAVSDNLQTEATTRADNDTILQNNINTVSNNLTAEIDNRTSADTILQGNINSLDDKVDSLTGALGDRIDTLSDTVTANYNTLDDKIDSINGALSDSINAVDDKYNSITGGLSDSITAIDNTINNYGDIVNYDAADFATSIQGALADTALQPNDNISLMNNDVGYITISSLPTVNNSSIVFQKNGTGFDTITLNQSNNDTVNITVPITAAEVNALPDTTTINDLTTSTQQAALNSGANTTNIGQIATNTTAISNEVTDRQNADIALQNQIDAIVSSSDVFDIVGTYAELQAYDISTVPVNDIIKVLVDSTHNDAATYYRCVETGGVKSWSYIGSEGAYYTKGEADAAFVPQSRTINGKALSNNVSLTASDVGALPDSTVIPTVNNSTITIQKNGSTVDTFNLNQATAKTINITVPTDTNDLTNGAGFITSAALTNYVTTDTAQDVSGRKTFLGEKAIYFKQNATTDKLGFTLYNPSNSELAALEWRPSTINGNALLALNCPQAGSNYVGFRYWANINIVAPRPAVNGTYFIPVNITNGNTTVTATNTGTVDISSLMPSLSGYQTTANLVTSVSSSSTDSQYPSAKLFYDTCGDIETLINAL